MSAHEAGRQLGYAAFPVVLLAIAAFIGWRMGKKRQSPKFVIWPVAVAALLLLVGMLGNHVRKVNEGTPASETRR